MKVSVLGGSGYVGGELLRLLLCHPEVELVSVVSRTYAGKYLFKVHPNLRGMTRLQFVPLNASSLAQDCDVIFTATPHGTSMRFTPEILKQGIKVVDMSADFRLKRPEDYIKWYGWEHKSPELLKEAAYGLPELHREEIRNARLVACPGCMATAAILALAPLVKDRLIEDRRIVVDVKIGSSGAGAKPTAASHHPERAGGVRPYKVEGHRHIAEIEQELNLMGSGPVAVSFTPHAVDMVRGIMATSHTFPLQALSAPEVWRAYRALYGSERFIRLIKDREGLYQLPNPKILQGSNYCDIGFELDTHINRLIVFSALDNLMKGASGQGVQCMNLICGLDESTGLSYAGIHPV
ncbi:MAG: N-acetyl-gamma-glutamyl-phosphate reductase [Candidatus Bathyarchaeia archaeon]